MRATKIPSRIKLRGGKVMQSTLRITCALFLALSVLGGTTVLADHGIVEEFRWECSGAGVPSQDVDSDGSMSGGGVSTAACRDRFGVSTVTGAGDLADWDGQSFCDFDGDGNPRGALLYYLTTDQVIRYDNGDLRYERIASSPPSTVCFNFITNDSFSVEAHSETVGGTGRFKGATGHSDGQGEGHTVGVMSAFTSRGKTEIVLQKDDNGHE
jgi:hypothetical protein